MRRRLFLLAALLGVGALLATLWAARGTVEIELVRSPRQEGLLKPRDAHARALGRPLEDDAFQPGRYPVRLERAGLRAVEVPVERQREGERIATHPDPVSLLVRSPFLWLAALALAAGSLAPTRRPAPPPKAPERWIGPYRILQELGQGATAEVFLAEGKEGRVALKLLAAVSDDEFKIRFEREADLCLRMDHPRVVKTYAWGVHEGRYWMAQQYLPGLALTQWVRRRGRHPREVARILSQLAEGLAYAHALGIVHRDLKPDNVLLTHRGEPVIADFGLARSQDFETITKTGTALGTPAYMAPEQIQGERNLTGAADVYALGVLGYELLVGHPPFQGDLMTVLMAHLTLDPPPLPGRPSGLLLAMLAKEPQQRPDLAELNNGPELAGRL